MAKILSNFLLTNHLSFKATAKVRSLFLTAKQNEKILSNYFLARFRAASFVWGRKDTPKSVMNEFCCSYF